MGTVHRFDDRASWLAGRKSVPHSLGGSDIAAAAALGRWPGGDHG